MKSMLVLLMILVVSCNGLEYLENSPKSPIAVESDSLPCPLSEEDFIVKIDNTILELNSEYRNLKTDEKITYARYADEVRAYDTIIYENFMVSYGLEIFTFALITPIYETSRGIKVGDSISDVFIKYGVDEKNNKSNFQFEQYRYSNNDKDWYYRKAIKFYVDENETITRIQFELDHP